MKVAGRTIIWQDLLILLAFVLFFGAGFLTSFSLTEIGQYTEYAEHLEANPAARSSLDFRYGLLTLQFATVAFLVILYYINRRAYMQKKTETSYLFLSIFTIFVFMLLFQDFINDLPIALKLAMGG